MIVGGASLPRASCLPWLAQAQEHRGKNARGTEAPPTGDVPGKSAGHGGPAHKEGHRARARGTEAPRTEMSLLK